MNKRRRYKAKRRRKEIRDLLLFFDRKVLAIRSMKKIAKLQWDLKNGSTISFGPDDNIDYSDSTYYGIDRSIFPHNKIDMNNE